ncbi:hypothetical protein WIS52_11425 [Pseudonocardia nematodicida]|uniref:PH domain-containing protein n=1 Tax=Pseudonocardia nematodicida TaxID=1206997 RepID=A0ABV1K9C3_9PSEU
MDGPVFDRRDQLDTVAAGLLDGERIIAVYDTPGATGFLGLTDRRVVLQDAGERTALTSVPYSRLGSVSLVDDRPAAGRRPVASHVAITAGGRTWEVGLRGDDEARHAHDVILWHLTR